MFSNHGEKWAFRVGIFNLAVGDCYWLSCPNATLTHQVPRINVVSLYILVIKRKLFLSLHWHSWVLGFGDSCLNPFTAGICTKPLFCCSQELGNSTTPSPGLRKQIIKYTFFTMAGVYISFLLILWLRHCFHCAMMENRFFDSVSCRESV